MKTYALFQQYIWLVNTIHKAENGITLEALGRYDEALQELRWAETVFREADLTRELGDYPLLQKICSRLAQSLKGPDSAYWTSVEFIISKNAPRRLGSHSSTCEAKI